MLPNALWKSLVQIGLGGYRLRQVWSGGRVTSLAAWSTDALAVYWTRDRSAAPSCRHLDTVSLALLHADYATPTVRQQFAEQRPYFRLMHRRDRRPVGRLPSRYAFTAVDPERQAQSVADLIGRCYRDLSPLPAEVGAWWTHPVYTPDLWLWVIDVARGEPVGLGIAEVDEQVGEGSLEWIQVLSGHRRLGLGRAVVAELLRRLSGRAAIVTVSGVKDGPDSPGSFYRRCGFSGDNVWWVLRRSGGKL